VTSTFALQRPRSRPLNALDPGPWCLFGARARGLVLDLSRLLANVGTCLDDRPGYTPGASTGAIGYANREIGIVTHPRPRSD
jgi:hypothetical protein